jgi:hypothetical protein
VLALIDTLRAYPGQVCPRLRTACTPLCAVLAGEGRAAPRCAAPHRAAPPPVIVGSKRLASLALMPRLQVPNLDLVLHTADVPCIKKVWRHGTPPHPLLGFQGSVRHYDLPFPDPSYWIDHTEAVEVRTAARARVAGCSSHGAAVLPTRGCSSHGAPVLSTRGCSSRGLTGGPAAAWRGRRARPLTSQPPDSAVQDPAGDSFPGWLGRTAALRDTYANATLADRLPRVVWRGSVGGGDPGLQWRHGIRRGGAVLCKPCSAHGGASAGRRQVARPCAYCCAALAHAGDAWRHAPSGWARRVAPGMTTDCCLT